LEKQDGVSGLNRKNGRKKIVVYYRFLWDIATRPIKPIPSNMIILGVAVLTFHLWFVIYFSVTH